MQQLGSAGLYLVFLFLPPELEGTILFLCFNKSFTEM